jgi:hypothetical protein
MTDLRTALEELATTVRSRRALYGIHLASEASDAYETLRAALAQSDDGKQAALEVAQRHGGTDGDHHKAWVIDQMVRALTGDGYDQFVTDTCAGEEGPDSYFWGVGIAP